MFLACGDIHAHLPVSLSVKKMEDSFPARRKSKRILSKKKFSAREALIQILTY